MSVLPFLHFFSFLAYCYLGIYIWIKNPKALVNRICAGFSFCFAVWSYAFIFLHGPGTGIEEARLHSHISSFGWIGFSSFFLWFILVFTGNTRITKKKWFYPVLFGIPAVLIYQQWGGFIINDFAREWYGLRSLYQASIWPYIFFVYYLSFMGIGFYLTFRFMRRTSNRVLKKQAKIILVTMVTSVVLGSFTDVIFTLANTLVIPNIADVTTLIWAFGAAYAIARYDFLTITPATAAENIISTMFDCLILLDPSGKISRVNQATLNVLGYTEAELKDKPVSTLLAPGEDGAVPGVEDAVKEIVGRRAVKNKEFRFRTKDGQTLPVLISSSVLEDVSGTAAGIVCVAKEFSEHKMLEEETLKSEKLEAIGMLAGGIAHDFNNVLSIILGNLQLAKEELESRVLTVKWLEGAEKAASQSVDLARKFITFAEGEWLDKRAVNLPHLIETMKAAGLPRNSPDSGTSMPVSYDLNLPLHLPPVQGDEGQLIQV
ncbi:MAG: PAS domain S-box protein, partial [bacterium]|nr:PAS domain S-box protein [bacterium]